jgi:hypothetical protein
MIKKFLGLVLMLVSSLALAVPAAYVHEMTGSGSAATAGKSRALAIGGLLESGDVISVDKGGSMTVKFEDGQIVVLQENSRFAIEKYDYNKKNVAQSSVAMSLLSGGMRFITGVIGGTRKEAIAMKAGTATIGIRGTDLAINIAGVNYTVTVQNGAITLNAVPISTGQGATGQTSAPVVPVPVITLPAAAIAAVAATVQKAVPPTNPVGVSQQSTLVQAVAKATALAATAQAPGATDAQKAEAATAARQVQEAVVATLQATQQAIQAAVQAGATSATATGAPAKSGTTPGATPPVGKSETQQAVDTVKAINAVLPEAQKLNATQINQLDQQAQQQAQQQRSAQQGTGQQGTGQQGPLPTAEQQQILNVLQEFKPPTPPPVTCGGAGQSPCQ